MNKETASKGNHDEQVQSVEREEAKEEGDEKVRDPWGVAYAIASQLSYSVTIPIVKIIYKHNAQISNYEVIYWKSISMVLFNYLFARFFGVFVMDVPRRYQRIMVLRAFVGFMGLQGWWSSIKFMPVFTANCIMFSMPVWASLIAFCYIKENLSCYDIVSVIFAFLGVIVINNPFQATDEKRDASGDNYLLGTIYALTGAISGSVAMICMRIMRKNIHYSISPFWFAAGCSLGAPFLHAVQMHGAYEDQRRKGEQTMSANYDWWTCLLILLASIFSFTG